MPEPELVGVADAERLEVAEGVPEPVGELLLLLLSGEEAEEVAEAVAETATEAEGLSLPEGEAEKEAEGVAAGVPVKEGVLEGEALWLGVPDCEAQASVHTSSPEAGTTVSAKPSEQLSQTLPA